MTKRDKANYMIQSVTHALDVLEELAKGPGEVGVTELSKRLRLHKNNVFRLLATLELKSFVEQNKATEDYRLGAKLIQLGHAFSLTSSLVTRAAPVIKALSDEIGETVSLVTYQNASVHFPISCESRKPVKVSARIGVSIPAKACAVGRLLTAQLSDTELGELLAGDSTQDVAIKSQLNELRASGQILDKGAVEADVVSLSRVVRDLSGSAVAAIEIATPQYRAKPEAYTAALEKACEELTSALGSVRLGLGISSMIEKQVSSADSSKAILPNMAATTTNITTTNKAN
jgi:IclR family KDG regulon transcriptional repressor